MRRREHQSGFGTTVILLAVLVVAGLSLTGLVLHQRHNTSSASKSAATSQTQATSQQQSTTTAQPAAATAQYLTIKEWGVKIPLSGNIKDAYYTVPLGISHNTDGRPSGIILGLTSLSNACGKVASSSPGADRALGEIVRSLPTEHDPVSGKLYTQLNPDGTTIGGYYYGYTSSTSYLTCAPRATFQSIDSAFGTATKGMVPASSTTN